MESHGDRLTSRVLPPEEWPRLVGTEAETVWPHLNAAASRIVVVERGTEIVGCEILVWVLHAECLWVHPALRGRSSVVRHLWPAIQQTVRDMGAAVFATASCSAHVTRLLRKLGGVPLLGDHYSVRV